MRRRGFVAAIAMTGAALAACGARPVRALERESDEAMARELTQGQRAVYEFDPVAHLAASQRLAIDLAVDREDRVYRIGDRLRLALRCEQDGYVTVFDVGTSGQATMIFPNHFQRSNRVYAGQAITIPSGSARFVINVGGPPGVDVIKVIATRQPLSLREQRQIAALTEQSPFAAGRPAQAVLRDLQVAAAPAAGIAGRAPPPNSWGTARMLVRVQAQA